MRRPRFVATLGFMAAVSLIAFGCAPSSQPTTQGQQPTQGVAGAQATPAGKTSSGAAPAKVSGTVHIMGVWGGDELDAFRQVAAGWEQQTGGQVQFEGTRDLSTVLRARVDGNNPPDIAILPNPALMNTFVQSNKLQSLNQVLDQNQFSNDYSQSWRDLGSVNGQVYGLFVKAVPKNTVWYNPSVFQKNGWQVPQTWDDLMKLADQMAATGTPPFSIGMEAGAASGWPGSDWIQEIYLRDSGPDMYDKWVKHQIPWTDPSIKAAFQRFGQIALNSKYVVGGPQNELAANFQDSSYLPFMAPPKAYLFFLGAFTQTFITTQFPNLKAGQDYDFFPLPPTNTQNTGVVTGGADMAVMFTNNDATKSFMQYMATAKSWEPWAKKGGFTSPNKSFDSSAYPDAVAQKIAKQLTDAKVFRFDADDTMPAPVQNAEFQAVLNYVRNPNDLDNILQSMENTAKDAYK